MGRLHDLDQKDAELVEQPDGKGDNEQGEHIGGGGDDGCYDKDGHDGVATIAAHQMAAEDAHAAQDGADNW